ncbi:interferon gamma receptor 1 [Epinephelus lanceolatus]
MLVGGAFTVLLFLISRVSAGNVLPPTNVTLSCTNLNVTVSWKYRERQPQTSFRVHITGSAGDYETETTDHQYDLSHFVWQSEERYLAFHYVTVTAIEGGNQSKSVHSETFTFNKFNYPQKRCALDFPPADLNENDSGATVSFVNPLYFYRELKEADKPNTVTFIYNVFSDGALKSGPAECTAAHEHCKHDVSFLEGVEKCVNLSGWLNAGNNVGGVVFRESGRICLSESTELHAVALTVMLFVLAILISGIIIIIYKANAWTMKIPSLPKLLISEPHPREWDMYAHMSHEHFSQAIVSQPCKNPSVSSEEENHLMENLDSSTGSGFQHDEFYMEGGRSEGYGRGDDSENSSVKSETDSTGLEEEDEEELEEVSVSPYDCPHTLQVDMGDGDMVTGYSKR